MASLLLRISAKALSYASWVGRPTQRQKPSEAAHSSCVRLTDTNPVRTEPILTTAVCRETGVRRFA